MLIACTILVARIADAQSPAFPLMPPAVFTQIEKALAALVMTTNDACFAKNHGEPKWALSWVTNTLDNPWMLPDVAERLHDACAVTNTSALWLLSADLMEITTGSDSGAVAKAVGMPAFPHELSDELVHPLEAFYQSAVEAYRQIDSAISALDAEERSYVAASFLVSAMETDTSAERRDALERAGIARPVQQRVESESDLLDGTAAAMSWLAQLNRLDLGAIHRAAQKLADASRQLADETVMVTQWPNESIRIPTSFGEIIVGTTNNDVYTDNALLILEPGGSDVYLEGAGAANGLAGSLVSVVVDYGGEDRYMAKGVFGPGSALFGIAIMLDLGGDDVYDSGGVGTAGAICGAAFVMDSQGDDIYRARVFAQGAAAAGFGMLVDVSGNDTYQAGYYSQGCAGVKGWGLLLDRSGNDVYVAGNVRRDSDRNEDRYLSLSQGFSIGARPHAGGGVGALVDLSGNDTYSADVYGQGVSYYYSAGFLIDDAGNDRYSMYQYGQGCGIHMSLGLLADAGGNDMYSGYILAQGAAHDYAVGMLFDHDGDDTYTADHHAQGRALNNAFALLVDRDGDDAYFGRQRDGTQGIGNEGGFRDYGSLALLIDLNGRDIYSGGFSNQTVTLRPLYGVVYDAGETEKHE